MKSLFEELGGTYRPEGDYLIPNLSLPPETEELQIGKYGRMRRRYLKEHHPLLYANLILHGTLMKHLSEIDRACNDRLELIEAAMMAANKAPGSLKGHFAFQSIKGYGQIIPGESAPRVAPACRSVAAESSDSARPRRIASTWR